MIRVFLFVGFCLVTLLVLINSVVNWRAERAWLECRRRLEARGEKLNWADYVPPPVPPEQNFALTPLLAKASGTNPVPLVLHGGRQRSPLAGSWRSGRFTGLADWNEHLRGGTNFADTLAAAAVESGVRVSDRASGLGILESLRRYDAAFAELRVASQRPHARFPTDWGTDLMRLELSHLAAFRGMSQTFSLRACAALAAGQPEEALADVQMNHRLIRALRHEPALISLLVRIAMNEIASQPVWEGLAARRWNEPQLAALDKELAALDFIADDLHAFRSERAAVNGTLDRLARSRAEAARSPEYFESTNRLASVALWILFPRWIIRNNQVLISEYYQEVVQSLERAVRDPSAHSPLDRALQDKWEKLFVRRSPNNFLAGLLLPATFKCTAKACNAQTTVNLARTGLALERYRLATGAFPEKLDALVPRFLEKVPRDVFDGQPLRYRLDRDGTFLLYSIGTNQKDDGGQVVMRKGGGVNLDAGDWVWSYSLR